LIINKFCYQIDYQQKLFVCFNERFSVVATNGNAYAAVAGGWLA